MIFLISSCKTRIVCSQIEAAKIAPLPLCDISFQFKRCACRCFDLNEFKTVDDMQCGGGFSSGNFSLETCEGLSGFFIEDMALEIKPKIKQLNMIKSDYCSSP
jgi:hypothetical protein